MIARKLGRITTPWQQDVLDVALERVDGEDSPFVYDTVVVIVGRRCGKTVTTFGVPLARGLLGPVLLDGDPNGTREPFRAAHVAQNLPAAFKRFDEDLVAPYRASMSPAAWSRRAIHFRNLANPSLTFDGSDSPDVRAHRDVSRIEVYSPRGEGLRGNKFAHVSFDEALVMSFNEALTINSAMRPTLKDLKGQAQVWVTSNISTDTGPDRWLWSLRDQGRADVAAGRTSGRCYIEYSIGDNDDPADERTWWAHYPALHDGLVRIEDLRSDWTATDFGPRRFAAEYLGRWPDASTNAQWLAITEDVWESARTELEVPTDAPVAIGVEMDPYARSSSIVAASLVPATDTVEVEVIDHRPGSGWTEDAVVALGPRVAAIGVDDYGPGHDLLVRLGAREETKDKLVPTHGNDIMAASYIFDAALREHRMLWRASDYHQVLTAAAGAAQRTTGRGWQWERRVSVSQTPLVAATLAAWALGRAPEEKSFFVY